MQSWTVTRKIGLGFAMMVVIVVGISVVGARALSKALAAEHRANEQLRHLSQAEEIGLLVEQNVVALSSLLLTGEQGFEAEIAETELRIDAGLAALEAQNEIGEGRTLANRLHAANRAHFETVEEVERLHDAGEAAAARAHFAGEVVAGFDSFRTALEAYVSHERALSNSLEAEAQEIATIARLEIAVLGSTAALLALAVAWLVSRTLKKQLGDAVQHLDSAATELQATANQQASAATEQASSITEISTTVRELLATGQQIAQSAQHVAKISGDTSHEVVQGDETVSKGRDAIGALKQQVDEIVEHMLALGHKSQEIGGILELINELSEQTNILAINATIEAAGGGEQSSRFAAVAQEIRKLADRVGESAKEVRALIDEVRSSANTTVMTTEQGLKAAETGAREFEGVASAFAQITELVTNTAQAAREIELSTKQQSTAIEQVNSAMQGITETARESEVGSRQTLDTAGELASLSRTLRAIVQREQAA